MISKSGSYWAAGITLRYWDRGSGEAWTGSIDFYDDGHDDNLAARRISTEGTLRTRRFVEGRPGEVALAAVIDTLITDAGRLGIRFRGSLSDKPGLFYDGDSENRDFPPPDGWKHMLRMQADRIGWDSYRVDAEVS